MENLPKRPTHEEDLYKPMVKILKAISKHAMELFLSDADEYPSQVLWRDEHSKRLRSQYACDMRPDIILALTANAHDAPPWWRFLQVMMEVKKSRGLSPQFLVQLFAYTRQALKEQLDRRFVLGLLFAKTDLSVWQVDRSGAIGSTPFNIHEVRSPCLASGGRPCLFCV